MKLTFEKQSASEASLRQKSPHEASLWQKSPHEASHRKRVTIWS